MPEEAPDSWPTSLEWGLEAYFRTSVMSAIQHRLSRMRTSGADRLVYNHMVLRLNDLQEGDEPEEYDLRFARGEAP